jgi:hypothetical protein
LSLALLEPRLDLLAQRDLVVQAQALQVAAVDEVLGRELREHPHE